MVGDYSNLVDCKRRSFFMTLAAITSLSPYINAVARPESWEVAAQKAINHASGTSIGWTGPRIGPRAAAHKRIALFAEDLRNGGTLSVALGVREALRVIGWDMQVFHSNGSNVTTRYVVEAALATKPDGLIVVGSDHRPLEEPLKLFSLSGRPIVGWHVAAVPGKIVGSAISLNVSTDPLKVAEITALAALMGRHGNRNVGAVIFTDSKFELAQIKSKKMAEVIRMYGGSVLDIIDLPISQSQYETASVVQILVKKYGERWTHALAINDIYFDYAAAELIRMRKSEDKPEMLSAGDGSSSAILRIMSRSFQTSTVAEPLNLHGWQIVDELNRLINGQPISEYQAPVHLITQANVDREGGLRLTYDPDNGYRGIYRAIWNR